MSTSLSGEVWTMGDRFTFGVADRTGDVLYLYSHWGGKDWDTNLKNAIYEAGTHSLSSERANRIVISQLIGGAWDSTAGYAFSINNVTDTEYGYVPVVDFNHSTVTFYEYSYETELGDALLKLTLLEYLNCKDIYALLHYAQQQLEEAREDVTV
jgi:hypothetical protein